jgi:hypothetical protein
MKKQHISELAVSTRTRHWQRPGRTKWAVLGRPTKMLPVRRSLTHFFQLVIESTIGAIRTRANCSGQTHPAVSRDLNARALPFDIED